ncbi:MAG: hypothetical protein WAU89_23245 [Candidatus Acidiferrales bacterium]
MSIAMRSRDFYKLCARIEASIKEQRPEMSAKGREELVLDTLEILRKTIDKPRKGKAKGK